MSFIKLYSNKIKVPTMLLALIKCNDISWCTLSVLCLAVQRTSQFEFITFQLSSSHMASHYHQALHGYHNSESSILSTVFNIKEEIFKVSHLTAIRAFPKSHSCVLHNFLDYFKLFPSTLWRSLFLETNRLGWESLWNNTKVSLKSYTTTESSGSVQGHAWN